MTDYSRTRRQWLALTAGAIVGCPIALAVVVSKLSDIVLGLGHIGHAGPAAPLALAFIAAIGALIFLNFFSPIAVGFVIVSLAYDAYRLQGWRTSKFIGLCLGTIALAGLWLWLSTETEEFLLISLADIAPFLSSAVALVLMFAALMVLRSPTANR